MSQIKLLNNNEYIKNINLIEGEIKYKNGDIYFGKIKDMKPHGSGKLMMNNKDIYNGEFLNGVFHGKGKYIFVEGDTFEGNFRNGKGHGYGIKKFKNGDLYKGNFENDHYHGYGEFTFNDKTTFKGNFSYGFADGEGEKIWPNGRNYKGNFLKGKFGGSGILNHENGYILNGTWKNGYFKNGTIVYDDNHKLKAIYTIPNNNEKDNKLYELYKIDNGCLNLEIGNDKNANFKKFEFIGKFKFNKPFKGILKIIIHNKNNESKEEKIILTYKGEFDENLKLHGNNCSVIYQNLNFNFTIKYNGQWINGKIKSGSHELILFKKRKYIFYGIFKNNVIPVIKSYDYFPAFLNIKKDEISTEINFKNFKLRNNIGYYDDYLSGSFTTDTGCYSGLFLNNLSHGLGTFQYNNNEMYIGKWSEDKKSGKGIYHFLNETVYEGFWKIDKFHGSGKLITPNFTYEGEFFNNKKHGIGKIIYSDGENYEGKWNNDSKEGFGVIKWANGDIYRGNWKNDRRNGHGEYIFKEDGQKIIGNWRNDEEDGMMTITNKDKKRCNTVLYKNGKIVNNNNKKSKKYVEL